MRKYSDKEVVEMLESDTAIIGSFDFNESIPACEMATVGRFGQKKGDAQGKTGYRVLVTSDGHPQSHIHIEGRDNDIKVCVKMTANQYFSHGGWPDKFSVKEARLFDEFLRKPYSKPFERPVGDVMFKITTYWEYAILQWKLENEGTEDDIPLQVDKDGYVIYPKQPDYTLLNAVRVGI